MVHFERWRVGDLDGVKEGDGHHHGVDAMVATRVAPEVNAEVEIDLAGGLEHLDARDA